MRLIARPHEQPKNIAESRQPRCADFCADSHRDTRVFCASCACVVDAKMLTLYGFPHTGDVAEWLKAAVC